MKLIVTQEDIDQGRPLSSRSCAIAKAAQRLPDVNVAAALPDVLVLTYADRVDEYRLPTEARRFIREFDLGWSVQPAEFDLGEKPSYSYRMASELVVA